MYFEDLKKGTRVKLDKINIKKEDMLEFAHKFDTLKIHTDEAYAKNTIFKDLIAPGVFSFMSMWVNFLKYDFTFCIFHKVMFFDFCSILFDKSYMIIFWIRFVCY